MSEREEFRYRWFVPGDLNGFFGLMVDNVAVMTLVAGILIFGFGFPADIVYTKMFPGTAFGVMFGDLVYTWMAFKLAQRTRSHDVTAMPLGLDTPSSIGVTLAVLGPAFLGLKTEMSPADAAMMTWYIGMATMVMIGMIKLVFSFGGSWVQRIVPEAGLLGSLAGIGLALIGLLPLLEIFSMPIVGLVALGVILYALVANIKLPGNFPGAAAAVLVGTVLYYSLGPVGYSGGEFHWPHPEFHFGFPVPTIGFVYGFGRALKYLPVAFPFAILTVIGGINVTESARIGGDDYNTRQILLTEAIATLVAGLCGGVCQSTPYIGQPAYKAMGSRAGYTLLTGLFVGFGGIFGYLGAIAEVIPKACLAPILVFVALDIAVQAFLATPARHGQAVAVAQLPTLARMLAIKIGVLVGPAYLALMGLPVTLSAAQSEVFKDYLKTGGPGLPEGLVITALGNGFILTGMLWGGFLAKLIDRRLRTATIYLLLLAGLTFVGITHSVYPDGDMYLQPWLLPDPARRVPLFFSAGYLILAAMVALLSFTRESQEPPSDGGHGGHFPPSQS